MENNEKVVDILEDLIKINNDRIEGYEKAIEDGKSDDSNFGSDYELLFNQMIQQSTDIRQELINEVRRLGGEADWEGTTNSGKIYRVWMDIKSSLSGKKDLTTLELCEYGEDAAQKAYEEALDSDEDMPLETMELISSQKADLKESHDLIKRQRDMHHVNS